jgi:hypothetical protein
MGAGKMIFILTPDDQIKKKEIDGTCDIFRRQGRFRQGCGGKT